MAAMLTKSPPITRVLAYAVLIGACLVLILCLAGIIGVWVGIGLAAAATGMAQQPAPPAFSPAFERDAVIKVMAAAADWQLAHPSGHQAYDWTQAAFYTGVIALAGVTDNPKYVGDARHGLPEPLACPASLEEVFLHGSAPRATCPMHGEEGLELDPAFDRWARAEGLPLAPARAARTMLISPADGDEFLLDPGVPLADQAVPVRARAAAGGTALAIVLDGKERGALQAPFATRFVARRGLQTIELRDVASGVLAARARFRVR